MSKWKKCFVFEDDYSSWYVDEEDCQGKGIEDIKKIIGISEKSRTNIEHTGELYYDSDNWTIDNSYRPYIKHSIYGHFKYLYNSDKPEYPLKDSSYPVYVQFGDTTKVGKEFTLDLSKFHYSGKPDSFDPSGMFYDCPVGEIIGLDSLPTFYNYSLIFNNLLNIKYLNLSDLNCHLWNSSTKGFAFCEDTQYLCWRCGSLESIDMSYLGFTDDGDPFFTTVFKDRCRELLCGDWDIEEKIVDEIYRYHHEMDFRSKYDIEHNWDHTESIDQFIGSQFFRNNNLKHVNLFGVKKGLYAVLFALSRASNNDKDILNLYIDKSSYKTALNYMYIISRHLTFWHDREPDPDFKSEVPVHNHWRSIRIIPTESYQEWEDYKQGSKDVSKVGKVFNFHYYGYFQSNKNKCIEDVRRLLEEGKSDKDVLKELVKRYSSIDILNAFNNLGKGNSLALSYCKKVILPDINITVGLIRGSESKLSIGEVAGLLYKKYPRTLVNEAIVLYLKDQHIIL